MSTCREFTVEAGRPDTIDKERLCALKENKVDLLNINLTQAKIEVLVKEIGNNILEELHQELITK